jgi:hypothetical protein
VSEPPHDEAPSGQGSPTGQPHPAAKESTPKESVEEQDEAQPPVSTTPGSEPFKVEVVEQKSRFTKDFWLAIAGLFATGSAGILGGWMTLHTSQQHDDQETARQKASFTQSQQKEAYTTFANAATDLSIAINIRFIAVVQRYPYNIVTNVLMPKADAETAFTELGHAQNAVDLFGSAATRDAANHVLDIASQNLFHIADWDGGHPVDSPDIPSCTEVVEFFNKGEFSDRPQLSDAIDRFNLAARNDLGISSIPSTQSSSETPLPAKERCAMYSH